ncbi:MULTISPECIES: WxL domain-containing protein [unclassified Enterococcus]|uniref:WxL domain-containing protein n=1 Tax=unclassified Enterococcus TaxID=2608891 RepID=UPI001CE037DD|nr:MULTISPECIES: WxL domain-containing protein [unclassified Enterococcus]MCA5012035.1 WxL domain-containing protein [Enterococcus sp. S23]MCA5015286.1 WxL domain-containing protein [Enterococcus sp. S22(2020)]
MKLTHKLCGVALLAALSTGAILPTVTHAAEEPLEWAGKGTIKFQDDDDTGKPIDPKDPDGPEIVKPPVNPAKGPLKVIAITDLEFGTNKVTPAAGNGWEYTASASEVEYVDGTKKVMPNFVQFKDTRADNLANKHKLTAKATTFTNEEGQELKSAELKFNNVTLVNPADQNQVNTAGVPAAQVLKTDGTTPTTFVTQDAEDKGFGQFVLQFGDTDDNTAADSVKLWVPSEGNKLSTSSGYSSTITWTIADAR